MARRYLDGKVKAENERLLAEVARLEDLVSAKDAEIARLTRSADLGGKTASPVLSSLFDGYDHPSYLTD